MYKVDKFVLFVSDVPQTVNGYSISINDLEKKTVC